MKKAIGLITIVLCVAIYYCSDNSRLTAEYTEFRDRKPFIRFEKYQYGDLYGLSLLSEFKEDVSVSPREITDSLPKTTNLFVFCDSYLHHRITPENFRGVNNLACLRWWYPVTALRLKSIDTSKRNIIVVELTERFVREIGMHPELAYELLKVGPQPPENTRQVRIPAATRLSLTDLRLFNPHLTSNLEFNMFDYPLFNFVKQWKADFNYHVFNRIDKDVTVDSLKHQLYYTPTITPDESTSSFAPVANKEIAAIVHHFNEIYGHYKSLGFTEVFLSIIPNPVTCIHPDLMKYNGLIPRIYATDSLLLPVIDVYKIFKTDPQKYYFRSDTHWNTNGLQTWIDQLDIRLNGNGKTKKNGPV